jgi:hypothetical protein
VSVFQRVRDVIGELLYMWNMIIHSTKHPRGNITAQHFMTIAQKLSTAVYKSILLYMFNITDQNYDWKEDPKFLKAKYSK